MSDEDSDFIEDEADEEWSAAADTWQELESQKEERASLVERKQRMREKKKRDAKGTKEARAPLKRSGYRIPRRPLDQVHREVIVAQVLRDAEATKLRSQWDSLTGGKPKAWQSGRRVRFRV